jgi:hypothetical protein
MSLPDQGTGGFSMDAAALILFFPKNPKPQNFS